MKRTFENLKNDINLKDFHEMIIKKYEVVSLDQIHFDNFTDAYNFIIRRLVNGISKNNIPNITSMKEDLHLLSIYNEHIDFPLEIKNRYINQFHPEENSNAQIRYMVFADNKVKKVLKAKQKESKISSTFERTLQIVLATIEALAKVTYPEIKIASSKSSRIMRSMLLDEDTMDLLAAVVTASSYNLIEFYHDYLSIDGDFEIKTVDQIAEFDSLVEATNIFVQKWFDFEEGDEFEDYQPLITDFDKIRLQTYLMYGCNFIKDTFVNNAIDELYNDTDKKIRVYSEANKTIKAKLDSIELKSNPFVIHDNSNTILDSITDIKLNEVEEVYYIDHIKNSLLKLDDKGINFKNLDGIALSVFYFMMDSCIYNMGSNDYEKTKGNVNAVLKKYNEHFDEVKEYYDYYCELEESISKRGIYVYNYDEFDRKLFKKMMALYEMYCQHYTNSKEALRLFYQFGSSRKNVVNRINKYLNGDDNNKDLYSFINTLSVAALAFDLSEEIDEDLLTSGVYPIYAATVAIYSYIKVSSIKGNLEGQKTYDKYLEYIKNGNKNVLSDEEFEFYQKVRPDSELNNLNPNPSHFFYYALKDEGSTYKEIMNFSTEETALMVASLKAIVDEEAKDGVEIDDIELRMYIDRFAREIKNRQRSIFIDEFYQFEVDEKETEIRRKNREIEILNNKLKDYGNYISNLKTANGKYEKQFNKELDIAKKEIINSYKVTESEYRDSIKDLQAEVERLKAANAALESQNKKLEEALFNEEDTSSNYSLNDVIGNNKITVVGGRYEKLRELQDRYPENITIITDPNFPDSSILNADYVICLYNFLAHGTYYRVKKLMNIRTDRFMYCRFDNLDLIESELARAIKSTQ